MEALKYLFQGIISERQLFVNFNTRRKCNIKQTSTFNHYIEGTGETSIRNKRWKCNGFVNITQNLEIFGNCVSFVNPPIWLNWDRLLILMVLVLTFLVINRIRMERNQITRFESVYKVLRLYGFLRFLKHISKIDLVYRFTWIIYKPGPCRIFPRCLKGSKNRFGRRDGW